MKNKIRLQVGDRLVREDVYRPTELILWFIVTFMFISIVSFMLGGFIPGLVTVGLGTFLGQLMWSDRRRADYILYKPRMRDLAWMSGFVVGFAVAVWAEYSFLLGLITLFVAVVVVTIVWWLTAIVRLTFKVF